MPLPDSAESSRGIEGGRRLQLRAARAEGFHPVVTIAIVAFNAGKTLSEAIDSVNRQRGRKSFELIVVDGGSNDGSLDVLAAHGDSVDYWVSEPDKGIYDAMNKALTLATGRWLLFLGADDELDRQFSDALDRLIDEEAIYYGNVRLKSTGELYAGKFNTYKLMQQNLHHQSIFYPISVYRSKRYDLAIRYLADYKYNIELWGTRRQRFSYLPFIIATYNDQGASSQGDPSFEAVRVQLIRQNFGPFFHLLKVVRTKMAQWRKARES